MSRDRRSPSLRLTTGCIACLLLAATGPDAQAQRFGKGRSPIYQEAPDDPPAPTAARDDPAARSPRGVYTRGVFTSIQVNVDESGLNIVGDAANEPSIAVSPVDDNTFVAGWRQFDNVASNFRQAGWAFSIDAGQSWTFPGVLESGVFRSDPVVDADRVGRFYYNSLLESFAMDIWRSLDGGQNWLSPVPAFGGDKNWMAVDRTGGVGDGHVYGTWQRFFNCCGDRTFTRSTNGGASYQNPVRPTNNPTFGTMTVGPDGTVYLAGTFEQNFGTFVLTKSENARDAGATPTFTSTVVDMGGSLGFQGSPNPGGLLGQAQVVVDGSGGPTHGNVYYLSSVNPPGGDPMDVHFARSVDGGSSFTPPMQVNDDAGNAWQWFGTIGVAPNGRIDVVWNDTRNSGQSTISELFYSYSYDAGDSWSPNEAVSPPFNSTIGWPNQSKIGDYYDMESDHYGSAVIYSATFNGEQDVYFLRVFPDCNDNGVSDVRDIENGDSGDGDGNLVPDECEGEFFLGEPAPGLPEAVNSFEVIGASSSQKVLLFGAAMVGSTEIPFCPGVNVGLGKGEEVGGNSTNGSGDTTILIKIPADASGDTLYFQAVDVSTCEVSNLVPFAFP